MLYLLLDKLLSNFCINNFDLFQSLNLDDSTINSKASENFKLKLVEKLDSNVFLTIIKILKQCESHLEPFCDSKGRCAILGLYSCYIFSPTFLINLENDISNLNNNNLFQKKKFTQIKYHEILKSLFERILTSWACLTQNDFNNSMIFSWFFFEILIKIIFEANNHENKSSPTIKSNNTSYKNILNNIQSNKCLLKLSLRCGNFVNKTLVDDNNLYDFIGCSFIHFIVQIFQYIDRGICRFMIKLFFDEIQYTDDNNVNQRISEFKLNLLHILMIDDRINELDIFYLTIQSQNTVCENEFVLVNFLKEKTPILNIFMSEMIHIWSNEQETALKAINIFFQFILTFLKESDQAIENINEKLTNESFNSLCSHLALAFYPILLYIMEFFNSDLCLKNKSTVSDEISINYEFVKDKFCIYSKYSIVSMLNNKISKYGINFLNNLMYLMLWIIKNLDKKWLINCLNTWNSLKYFFLILLYIFKDHFNLLLLYIVVLLEHNIVKMKEKKKLLFHVLNHKQV